MIQANEVRIGNLYMSTDRTNNVYQVSAKDILAWSKGAIFGKYLELSEEWLIKLGFIKIVSESADLFLIDLVKIGSYKALKQLCLFFEKDKGYWVISFVDNYSSRELTELFPFGIKYVHDLQNIYFAITHKELIRL